MTETRSCEVMLSADLIRICDTLQPETICCFDVPDVSWLPLETLIRTPGSTWFVDSNAGRVGELLGRHIARAHDGRPCLACDPAVEGRDVCARYVPSTNQDSSISCETRRAIPRDPMYCRHFVPGRRLRVINGDARRGRQAGFTTRVETFIAAASTPATALQEALLACERTAELNVPLPIEDGSFDLVISIRGPSQLERAYNYFAERMTRRFGRWETGATAQILRARDELRRALFRKQLEAHVIEMARVTHPMRGRLYYATLPVEPTSNGGWLLERGFGECFDALSACFAFDFELFAPEVFLRRCDDRLVLQSALLRPKAGIGGTR